MLSCDEQTKDNRKCVINSTFLMISAEARMSVALHPSMLSVGSLANAKQCVNQGKEARGNQMSLIRDFTGGKVYISGVGANDK